MRFHIGGISSNNKAFEVLVTSIETEGIDRLTGEIDPSVWWSASRFAPFEAGSFADDENMMIRAKPWPQKEGLAVLDLVFWGL